MSMHNMGLDEGSWSGSSEPFDTEAAAESGRQLREVEAELQASLDAKAHLSAAHTRQAEGNFGYYPEEAIEICGDGYVTMMAQSFEDNSLLLFQVGEMGIEDIVAFSTLEEAQEYLNKLIDFEPV